MLDGGGARNKESWLNREEVRHSERERMAAMGLQENRSGLHERRSAVIPI